MPIPALDFDLLKAHAIKKPKEFLYSHPEYKLSFLESIYLKYFIFLHKRGYSVAAITKHKEFYGLDFFVNKHTLIPRPDTELMAAEAIEEIKKSDEKITLIDVGTGSGCIPISIACHLERSREIPYTEREGFLHFGRNDMQIFATDISGKALKVARKNARTHNVNIEFFHGNLLEPIIKKILNLKSKILITANLPYLTEKQFQDEPSIKREPKNALVAESNGLALYEELLNQIKQLPYILHSKFCILLEIDPSQSKIITNIIKQYLPNSKIEIKKDLSGLDRLVKIS